MFRGGRGAFLGSGFGEYAGGNRRGRGGRGRGGGGRGGRRGGPAAGAAAGAGPRVAQNQTSNSQNTNKHNLNNKSNSKIDAKKKKPNKEPVEDTVDLTDPDHMFRSKLAKKDPVIGYGIRYNPNDPNSMKPIRKIYVCKIGEASTKDLKDIFGQYGPVTHCKIMDSRHASYAFITFDHPNDALKALQNTSYYKTDPLIVKEAHQKHQIPPQPEHLDKLFVITAPDQCYISKLNNDCLRQIFSYFNIVERTRIETVCSRWQQLIRSMMLVVRELDFTKPPLSSLFTFTLVARYDVAFKQLSQYVANNLNSLTLRKFTDDRTFDLITNYRALERLSLNNMNINECFKKINSFKRVLSQIKHLELVRCTMMESTGHFPGKLFTLLKNLESLTIKKPPTGVYGLSLNLYLQYPSTIKCLFLNDVELDLGLFETFLKKNSKTLKELKLYACHSRSEEFHREFTTVISKHCPNLEVLCLEYIKSSALLKLDDVYKLKKLKKLCLNDPSSLTEDQLGKIVRNCKELEHVELNRMPYVSTEVFASLGKLPKLSYLSICGTNYLEDIDDEKLIQLANNLINPTNFKHLYCSKTRFSDEAFYAILTICTHLETLDVSYCKKITGATLLTAEEVTTQRLHNKPLRINIKDTEFAKDVPKGTERRSNNRLIIEQSSNDHINNMEFTSIYGSGTVFIDSDDDDMDSDDDDDVDPIDMMNALQLMDSDDDFMYNLYVMGENIHHLYELADSDEDNIFL